MLQQLILIKLHHCPGMRLEQVQLVNLLLDAEEAQVGHLMLVAIVVNIF